MASELAKAYVQIIPSAKGIASGIKSTIDGEGEDTGASFGAAMAGKVKGVLAAAGIGAALTAAIGAAINEGAALEQSIGGIETLFGDSAERVKQNAAEAYRTAGMSANAYMELTTSFAAGLIKSLSGDTEAAASVADMAMTDMSDNANKMGTSLDAITNAYQGFAKQNYTMLDNLKLGYGGTQSEMERLLADAQALTGVEYNMDNLADVYAAIHAIQEDLGITGTTAKEAASTIAGSLAGMKAAFSNVLGQLTLGQDVGPALEALAQTVATFMANNLIPAVWNVLKALPGALVSFIKTLVPIMAPAALAVVDHFCADIAAQMANVITAGANMLGAFIGGLVSGAQDMGAAALAVIDQFCADIAAQMASVITTGVTMLGELVSGLLSAIPNMVAAIPKIIDALKAAFLAVDWLALGKDIITGISEGIKNSASLIGEAAKDAASRALQAAKDFFGIHSPSRLMRDQIGRYIPAGIAEGIRGNLASITDAMQDAADQTVDSAQARLVANLADSRASLSGATPAATNNTTNNVQNIYFEQPMQAPDEIARALRIQQTYGLAGAR